jgi:pyrroline-5-carboxylate reductase
MELGVKLVMIGCGNMGRAMLAGWLASGRLSPEEVDVVEPNQANRDLAAELGVRVHADAEGARGLSPKLLMVAVKPQVIADVLPAYKGMVERGAAVISIAAGVPIARYEDILGASAAIIRCMPNTPAAIGAGMMVTVANPNADDALRAYVADLLSASGAVAEIPDEALMDAVTAVSGSGPAYVFNFIEALTGAAEKTGLPSDIAALLARQTVFGAAKLAFESGTAPAELRRQVTSPNGTTAAALAVLMADDGLGPLLEEAVEAAKSRSIELGR